MDSQAPTKRRLHFVINLVSVIACLLVVCRAPAVAQSQFITEYSMDGEPTDVPFEYVAHQILVRGQAADKKDLTLIFDSGASVPVFDKTLELNGYNFPAKMIREAEGATAAQSVLLDSLSIGAPAQQVHARNLPVLLTDFAQVSRVIGQKVDGIVGLSFMAGFVVEIDYVKKRLRFYTPRTLNIADRHADNLTTFLYSLHDSEPKYHISNLLVSGKLAGDYDYDFILDTGFGGYVSVARSAAELSGLIKANTPHIPGASYSVTHQFRSDKIRASFLMLGEINLSNRVVQIDTRNGDSFGQNGLVGNRLLQNYRILLDFTRRKLWMERVVPQEEPDESARPTLGLTVRTDGGLIQVVRTAAASPAEQAGLQKGDTILEINRVSIGELGLAGAIDLLASPGGDITLEILRSDGDGTGEKGHTMTFRLKPSSPLDWMTGDPK